MYKHILIGIDGSKQAKQAFTIGCSLAEALNAKISLLWVINRDRSMDISFGASEDFYREQAQYARENLQPYIKEATDKKLTVSENVLVGNAKNILADTFPKENGIDLIVIGQTGMNNIEKLVVGSHTSYVIRNSACDVLVVK
ncbi:universal stress protein [Ligilactobacillus sp. WILCCON 0076]|uniref:Universal stress protein n=1 Tax=Ligilactobacillus ubinensis TaxID=2876789 RepID=A0A9X2FH48_9LACO|nr:universal stress protein [Ligilactobacillus ubinensis]MCP0886129.1 universal stress protein [Ligilactobacillus ubinensis]